MGVGLDTAMAFSHSILIGKLVYKLTNLYS